MREYYFCGFRMSEANVRQAKIVFAQNRNGNLNYKKYMPQKLGQNFLNNLEIVNRIIKYANLTEDDLVLEIGPGEGILTETLAKKAKKVISIEIDDTLVPALKEKFKNNKNVEIIQGDILSINLPSLLKANEAKNYKLIANIPYYITSKIIRLFLESEFPPQEIVLMVQEEVAERIVAVPGKMSKLSVSVQYYGSAEVLFAVGKENFNPSPEVESAVIRISQIAKRGAQSAEQKERERKFFQTVRAGFCARRKTLANNLSNSLHLDKRAVEEKLKKAGISPTARAQELSLEKWKLISKIF